MTSSLHRLARLKPLRLGVVALTAMVPAACEGGTDDPAPRPAETRQRNTPVRERIQHEGVISARADVRVTGRRAQRIRGWGASVVASTLNDPLVVPGGMSAEELRRLDRAVFRGAGINLVRVFGPGYGQDPSAGPLAPNDARLAFMRRVRPYGVRFMLTGADAPPELKDGTKLLNGAEAGFARYLADLLSAADRAGVPFSYVAVTNEPDNGRALVQLTGEQTASTYRELLRILRARGLGARIVLGDNTGWAVTARYVDVALQQPDLREAAVAIASHGYRNNAAGRRLVADISRRDALPVWQTEWGAGCPTCGDEDTIENALPWSSQISNALTEARTSAWFTFRAIADSGHGPGDALLVRTRNSTKPFYASKRYHVFRQYSSAAPRGARRLITRAPANLEAVAFRFRRSIRLVLTNTGAAPVRLRVSLGRRAGALRARRTSETESFARLPGRRYSGAPVAVELPPHSVTTLSVVAG
jgi:O-glycosyl hydrolase